MRVAAARRLALALLAAAPLCGCAAGAGGGYLCSPNDRTWDKDGDQYIVPPTRDRAGDLSCE